MQAINNENIDAKLFELLDKEEKLNAEVLRPSVSYWQDVWRRFKENKLAMIGLVTVIIIILAAIFGPMLSPYSYSDQFLDYQGIGPNSKFWLGTDTLGRDILVRVLYGARISLAVGFVASFNKSYRRCYLRWNLWIYRWQSRAIS